MQKRIRPTESVIDWRTLRARKGYLDLHNADLIQATGCSSATVSAFFAGNERMNLDTIIRLSAALGLRAKVTFDVAEDTAGTSVTN